MGQSTDAIICYGVALTEEEPFWSKREEVLSSAGFDPSDDDDDSILAFLLGGLARFESDDFSGSEYEEHRATEVKILNESGVELVSHCSSDYPMYILATSGSVLRAYRGCPKMFSMGQEAGGVNKLKQALAALGHEASEPQWTLCSDWGY